MSSGRSSSACAENQLVGAGIVGRLVAVDGFGPRSFAGLALVVCRRGLEQRVLGHFLGDERLELEVAQLQQLDRLRQLRRQHQRLALADA